MAGELLDDEVPFKADLDIDGSGRLEGPLDDGMAIRDERGCPRDPLALAAGWQMCSPREERGIGAAQEEQVTVGRMTEARSIC